YKRTSGEAPPGCTCRTRVSRRSAQGNRLVLPSTVMAYRATVLRVDGTSATELFDGDPPLAWLKEQVGGFIELVPGQPHRVIVNEDARALGLPVNELAAERLGD